ncbi:MAG TPA: Na+/H+ antiporter NhaA, partial [Chitinophagales bacterium]|nr:Na+/H+ antiporter NhaA [Chitinophagales bacterium]
MAIFFFVVGLELKKEIVAGELSSPKKAMMPIVSAIGGMVIPASIYLLLNSNSGTEHGWGIPMATDIAFALGILMFLGDKVPVSLKIFLLALAIVDDLGAILVIAFFYSSDISFLNLIIGMAFLGAMFIGNKMGVRSTLFYAVLGIGGLWTAFLLSGVHATIAAVLAAFMIPADSRISEKDYVEDIKEKLKAFAAIDPDDKVPVLKEEQINILKKIQESTKLASTPMQNLTNIISPISTFIVLPIFAIANAGVSFDVEMSTLFSTNIAVGVGLGLVLGKILGIFGFAFILVKLGLGSLPTGMSLKNLFGIALLAAIGFTMSIFIASLAFTEQLHIDQAKIGIFAGSIIGGVAGYIYLSLISKPQIEQ